MIICAKCEYKNIEGSVFCQQCGSRLTSSTETRVNASGGSAGFVNQQQNKFSPVNKKVFTKGPFVKSNALDPLETERPDLFTAFLILNYVVVLIIGLSSFLIFNSPALIFLILILLAGIYFWLVFSLQHYDNTARAIYLLLITFGLVFILFGVNVVVLKILSIAIVGFSFYILIFHKPTVKLFKGSEVGRAYNTVKNKDTSGRTVRDIDGHELAYFEQNVMQGNKGG